MRLTIVNAENPGHCEVWPMNYGKHREKQSFVKLENKARLMEKSYLLCTWGGLIHTKVYRIKKARICKDWEGNYELWFELESVAEMESHERRIEILKKVKSAIYRGKLSIPKKRFRPMFRII